MDYIISILPQMWLGTIETLKLFFITIVLSIPLGILLALARVSVTWQSAQCRWCLCLAAARYAADAAAFIRLLRTSIYSRYRDQDG